ncbi:hypothetical protein BDZ85DRAFT_255059 [Elsinoe ampelina]|uniref:Uncharacterized protein n=1 Tax=Elsinoe ampelina TaxID=302913 RepID=A0A6A6GQ78_9PEZI|nr:hypothetical protein BDZ85DRAFT_255059 [Elsinoe ampelina]
MIQQINPHLILPQVLRKVNPLTSILLLLLHAIMTLQELIPRRLGLGWWQVHVVLLVKVDVLHGGGADLPVFLLGGGYGCGVCRRWFSWR